jgi:hypothetical protein
MHCKYGELVGARNITTVCPKGEEKKAHTI